MILTIDVAYAFAAAVDLGVGLVVVFRYWKVVNTALRGWLVALLLHGMTLFLGYTIRASLDQVPPWPTLALSAVSLLFTGAVMVFSARRQNQIIERLRLTNWLMQSPERIRRVMLLLEDEQRVLDRRERVLAKAGHASGTSTRHRSGT